MPHVVVSAERGGVEERRDTYLLIPSRADVLAKIRGGENLEIKTRLAIEPPLELWEMALSASFPLGGRDVAQVRDAFRADALAGDALTDAERAIDALQANAHVFGVGKRRALYARGACRAEACVATIAQACWDTIAFEAADPRAVNRAIEDVGLAGLENVPYGERLRRSATPENG